MAELNLSVSPVQRTMLEQWYALGKLVGGIGSDSLDRLIEMSLNYRHVINQYFDSSDISLIDIGSGVGIPGLTLAMQREFREVVLLESMARRAKVAKEYVNLLGLDKRIEVVHGRAEDFFEDFGERFQVVVSRCFGPPPLLAEVALPFMARGGLLIVSEPPAAGENANRWPSKALAQLGYHSPAYVRFDQHFVVLRRSNTSVGRPRSYQLMVKAPLWRVR